jgi:predicted 2-oxoglutarate/Fe(II)-dependent dioxygenase YbiX
MNMLNPQEYPLLDFVQVYKKTLTSKQCESVLNKINDSAWSPHQWTDYNKTLESKDINNDCTRAVLSNGVNRLLVSGLISNTVNEYRKYIKKVLKTEEQFNFNFNGMTIPSINRYNVGQEMRVHSDHITSIFDGEMKGIPTLSIVGLLNEDFDGGEFKFWDKYDMNLEIGDILVFPSNFLYNHQVNKVTRGIRYSFVSWIY